MLTANGHAVVVPRPRSKTRNLWPFRFRWSADRHAHTVHPSCTSPCRSALTRMLAARCILGPWCFRTSGSASRHAQAIALLVALGPFAPQNDPRACTSLLQMLVTVESRSRGVIVRMHSVHCTLHWRRFHLSISSTSMRTGPTIINSNVACSSAFTFTRAATQSVPLLWNAMCAASVQTFGAPRHHCYRLIIARTVSEPCSGRRHV